MNTFDFDLNLRVVLASIVATTDMVAIVPHSVGSQLSQHNEVKLLPLPIAIPAFDIRQCWQERFHDDKGNRWLRQQFMDIYRALLCKAVNPKPSTITQTALGLPTDGHRHPAELQLDQSA